MRYTVKVKPLSKKNEVICNGDGTVLIYVTAPPSNGKANEKVVELLSEYFRKPKRSISILRGLKSRTKTIEVL